MPVLLFTYHAYASWLPDHKRGYVRRQQGIQSPNQKEADRYRRQMKESPVAFGTEVQREILTACRAAADRQAFELHAAGFDQSHAHVLVSWEDDKPALQRRSNLKSSLTRHLNTTIGRRTWFSENASGKQVKDRNHYDYLVNEYLPSHPGLYWNRD